MRTGKGSSPISLEYTICRLMIRQKKSGKCKTGSKLAYKKNKSTSDKEEPLSYQSRARLSSGESLSRCYRDVASRWVDATHLHAQLPVPFYCSLSKANIVCNNTFAPLAISTAFVNSLGE